VQGGRDSLVRHYVVGLRRSTGHHAPAYGYSIAAGAAALVLTKLHGTPDLLSIFMFIVGTSSAVLLINLLATRVYRQESPEQPQPVVALGTSFSVVSISATTGIVIAIGYLLAGWEAWLVSGFVFTTVYLVLVGLELAVAVLLHPRGTTQR
jgi:hypothetical protein